jgi:TolA-binding protein
MTISDQGMQDPGMQSELHRLQRTVDRLELQIEHLERQWENQSERAERTIDRLPETALLSSSFLSRAFAVWGHQFVASLIISVIPAALWCALVVVFRVLAR